MRETQRENSERLRDRQTDRERFMRKSLSLELCHVHMSSAHASSGGGGGGGGVF
jgi:hypothetical protein